MKVLFACGGTAGHINPALAIADLLKKKTSGFSALFVGTPDGMENRLVKAAGYPIRHVPVKGLRRSLSPRNLAAGASLLRSFGIVRRILDEEAPDLVLGTGGYVCFPVLYAASGRGIPTVLHESNARAGIAARLISRRTDLALINFPSAKKDFRNAGRTVVSGNPLRHEFYSPDRQKARAGLELSQNDLFLVVFGGSLGAAKLNEAASRALLRLLPAFPNLKVLHAVGKNGGEIEIENERYRRTIYIDDMPAVLTAADLAVCRAGAMTLSEIAATGTPSVLIPYPAATGDHQTKNARAFAEANAAVLLPDANANEETLATVIGRLLSEPERRNRISEAAKRFAVPETEDVILRELLYLCPKIDG